MSGVHLVLDSHMRRSIGMGMLVLPCISHIHGAVLGLEDNTGTRSLNSMLSMTMYGVSETMGLLFA